MKRRDWCIFFYGHNALRHEDITLMAGGQQMWLTEHKLKCQLLVIPS